MAVKIRLMRLGKKKQPVYRVVVADGRTPRDGRYIEAIGRYDARHEPSLIEIDNDRAVDWLGKGAQPTDPVRKLLEISGAWSKFKISKGEIHTVGSKVVDETAAAPAAQAAASDSSVEPADEEAVADADADADGEAEAAAGADDSSDETADAGGEDE